MSESTLFFENMPSFANFHDLLKDDNYQSAPVDWWVIITDVKGSTKAIENGRYKDVNTIGAATLAAIQNATGKLQFPFVFGGDGATALIPQEYKEQVEQELSALRSISQNRFQLGLRVGIISVKELQEHDFPVLIAKYKLPGNYPLAIFRGGALTKAEELIKGTESKYEVPAHQKTETNLRNLSCRWQPLQSKNGTVVSLLMVDPMNRTAVYSEFVQRLEAILGGDANQANPVNVSHMQYRSTTDMLQHDKKHQQSFWSYLPRMIDTIFATVLFRWGLYKLIPKLRNYIHQTATHSDFRKFDDMLRMILDCSDEQCKRLKSLCHDMRERHQICYGVHESPSALMTCYVPSFADGSHIHFIDGGNGGYAMAAKRLKEQLRLLPKEN